jgi:hypothetical protein
MRVEDLVVEVRDRSLDRIGIIPVQDLVDATFVVRYNNVGTWSITVPYGNRLGEFLRLPGYGIVVTGTQGETIISGPTLTAKLEQTQDNTEGTWLIEGSSDDIILSERLAYPTPATADVSAQTSGYDIRTGPAETVIKQYIDVNIGPSAPAGRKIPYLAIEADAARGQTVAATARFTPIQELAYDLAQVGELGYYITQQNGTLEFSMYEPTDRSDIIRMDVQNRKLSSSTYSYGTAKVTRAIVAGRGEAENRIFIERTSSESLNAEIDWNRRIEVFKDARQSESTDELNTAGDELLVDLGKTITEFSVTPSDDQTMVYGVDWFLGDRVAVVANEIETTAVVTEVGIQIAADGVRIGATVGTPVAIEFESKLLAKQQNHEDRIGYLERSNSGYGINTSWTVEGGTIGGTPPVFPPDAIIGTFNRIGNLVHFTINVDFDDITNFGTGQYFVTLPYSALSDYLFSSGHLLDFSANKSYIILGQVDADSDQMRLSYLGSNGQLESFEHNAPKTLTVDDHFDISGTYEIEG